MNTSCLTVKEDWKILTFSPLEKIVTKPYNHHGPFDVVTKFTLDEALIEADNRFFATKRDPISEPRRLSGKTRIQKEGEGLHQDKCRQVAESNQPGQNEAVLCAAISAVDDGAGG